MPAGTQVDAGSSRARSIAARSAPGSLASYSVSVPGARAASSRVYAESGTSGRRPWPIQVAIDAEPPTRWFGAIGMPAACSAPASSGSGTNPVTRSR